MCRIRASLTRKERTTQIKKDILQKQNADRLIFDNEDSEDEDNSEDELIGLSDDEDSFQNEDNWQRHVSKWAEMINEEETAQRDEAAYFLNLDMSNIGHPAVNVAAKWKLRDLFSNTLEPLSFLSNL